VLAAAGDKSNERHVRKRPVFSRVTPCCQHQPAEPALPGQPRHSQCSLAAGRGWCRTPGRGCWPSWPTGPAGMRVIVRRERPHPGAQLTFSDAGGWRFQTFATDTEVGQLAHLEARHRAHARVEDRIRCAKNTGLAHLPSGSSTSTPSGSSSSASPATYSPGPGCCSSTALWPLPSRSSCATGCCTWPAAWSAADDDCSSGSTATGPGKTRSSTPSPGSSPCRSRPTDRELSPLRTRRRSRRSGRPLPPAQDQIKPERLNDLPLGRLPRDGASD